MTSSSVRQNIFKLPALTPEQVEKLLESQKICRMALKDDPSPYIIALDYLYLDGCMYFHFADYGRKMDLIRRDPNVSVQVDNFFENGRHFDTITLAGQLKKVTKREEKCGAAKALVDSAKARGGKKNVAARHGLKALEADALSPTFYRLAVKDYVALRSTG